MSMCLHSILQCAEVTAVYFSLTLLYPFIFLRRKLSTFSLPAKIMASFMAGNFYLQAVVCVLQLIHFSNFFTLLISLFLPVIILYSKQIINGIKKIFRTIIRLTNGVLGFKTLSLNRIRKIWTDLLKRLPHNFKISNIIEIILSICAIGVILVFYGGALTESYGYAATDTAVVNSGWRWINADTPTHSSWIYELCNNNLYSDGIYPEGYHWTIYFIHTIFRFPIYTILRVFFVVQMLSICLMMLCFLKAICKSRYIPYLSVIIYTGSSLFVWNAYARLYAALPQEFSMIFLLPTLYFALNFFKQYAHDIKEAKEKSIGNEAKTEPASSVKLYRRFADRILAFLHIPSTQSLIFFSVSVSLTMSAHFYGIIIAGVLCVGAAIGYCFRVFRPRYLKRIVCAGLAGIMLSALPMVICYISGTPLQDSLSWATDVVSGTDSISKAIAKEKAANGAETAVTGNDKQESASQIWNKMCSRAETYSSGKNNSLNDYGFSLAKMYINSIIALILISDIFFFILSDIDYGAFILSLGAGELFLFLLMCSDILNIPRIMEADRICLFFVYLLPVVWGLLLDAVIYLISYLVMYVIFGHFKSFKAFSAASFAALSCCVFSMTYFNSWRNFPKIIGLETNGAITCLENIIKTEKEKTWTICSDPDELFMCNEYGFHYEIIRLLWEVNEHSEKRITIPTEKIFFFIEKIPINYGGSGGGGKPISAEFAAKELPPYSFEAYSGTNRQVTMSHMYSWVQQFMKFYPHDMSVYYEDEQFVCYELKQNPYSLYDLNIDYGYTGPAAVNGGNT